MSVLNVLHVHTRLILGGADENTLFTVNQLDRHRYRVALAVGGGSEAGMLARVAPDVEVVVIPELVREVSPGRDLAALRRLRRLMRERRFDIVHTHTAKAGILGRVAARSVSAPVIIHTLHGSTFHRALGPIEYALYWLLEKATGAFTHQLICVGEDMKQRYLAAGIASPERYAVILSGMDLSAFEAAGEMSALRRAEVRRSLGVPADAPLVGQVARLEERKGYRYFLELAEQVVHRVPGAHLVGLGAGEQHEFLRAEAARRGLAERVRFPGFRPDIAEVLAALDVVVLTSLWEGLPRVLVQAAACGVPAVTFEVEGAREVVKEGVNGFVVPSKDVAQLAERVIGLLTDSARAWRMGAAGKHLVHGGWTTDAMVHEIEKVYERLSPAGAPGEGSVSRADATSEAAS